MFYSTIAFALEFLRNAYILFYATDDFNSIVISKI